MLLYANAAFMCLSATLFLRLLPTPPTHYDSGSSYEHHDYKGSSSTESWQVEFLLAVSVSFNTGLIITVIVLRHREAQG